MLEELLYTDRKLLDAWDKKMAIYPVEDWPYLHYRQREAALHSQWRGSDHIKEVTPRVRQAIEEGVRYHQSTSITTGKWTGLGVLPGWLKSLWITCITWVSW